jgi:hypothetical protein
MKLAPPLAEAEDPTFDEAKEGGRIHMPGTILPEPGRTVVAANKIAPLLNHAPPTHHHFILLLTLSADRPTMIHVPRLCADSQDIPIHNLGSRVRSSLATLSDRTTGLETAS